MNLPMIFILALLISCGDSSQTDEGSADQPKLIAKVPMESASRGSNLGLKTNGALQTINLEYLPTRRGNVNLPSCLDLPDDMELGIWTCTQDKKVETFPLKAKHFPMHCENNSNLNRTAKEPITFPACFSGIGIHEFTPPIRFLGKEPK